MVNDCSYVGIGTQWVSGLPIHLADSLVGFATELFGPGINWRLETPTYSSMGM